MIVKAIKIDGKENKMFHILYAILPERKTWFEVSPSEVANRIHMAESTVRYNVNQLVKLGYLRDVGKGYEPTDKVLFLKQN